MYMLCVFICIVVFVLLLLFIIYSFFKKIIFEYVKNEKTKQTNKYCRKK